MRTDHLQSGWLEVVASVLLKQQPAASKSAIGEHANLLLCVSVKISVQMGEEISVKTCLESSSTAATAILEPVNCPNMSFSAGAAFPHADKAKSIYAWNTSQATHRAKPEKKGTCTESVRICEHSPTPRICKCCGNAATKDVSRQSCQTERCCTREGIDVLLYLTTL